MRLLLLAVLLTFPQFSFADEIPCYNEIEEHANKAHPGFYIHDIQATEKYLTPGEETFVEKAEVHHYEGFDFDVRIYTVKASSHGMTFKYAYTVRPETCRTYAMFEANFD